MMLVVTRNLPPRVGGMERLVLHVVEALRAEYRVHVVGPAGCAKHLSQDVAITEIPERPLAWFLFRVGLAALWRGLSFRPTLVFAGSGLAAPFAWLAARLARCKCAVYLHGLDIEARNPVYRTIWPWFLRRCDLVFVNSLFSKSLAQGIGISADRIRIQHPGVALPDMTLAAAKRRNFRERYGLGDAPVMLSVGRITARKGLDVFVRHILPDILKDCPQARLVVIGDEARNALLKGQAVVEGIQQELASQGLTGSVLFLGEHSQDDPIITEAYFAADVHVFPVQQRPHDNEGFGMVAIEAAAHGLPTVAFAAGGVPEAVGDGVSGRLVPAGDNDGFARAVLAYLQNPEFSSHEPWTFSQRFAWNVFGEHMREGLKGEGGGVGEGGGLKLET